MWSAKIRLPQINPITWAQERAGPSCSHFLKWEVWATWVNTYQRLRCLQFTRRPRHGQELSHHPPRNFWKTDFPHPSHYTKIKHSTTSLNKILTCSTKWLSEVVHHGIPWHQRLTFDTISQCLEGQRHQITRFVLDNEALKNTMGVCTKKHQPSLLSESKFI